MKTYDMYIAIYIYIYIPLHKYAYKCTNCTSRKATFRAYLSANSPPISLHPGVGGSAAFSALSRNAVWNPGPWKTRGGGVESSSRKVSRWVVVGSQVEESNVDLSES